MEDVLFAILQQVGGAIAALVIVLGGLWAFGKDAILARFEAALTRDQSVFEYQLERAAVVGDAHAKAVFESSLEVWTALGDLETHVERLWHVASRTNVQAAADALERAKQMTHSHSALINDSELASLRTAISRMSDFVQGKELLADLQDHGASSAEVERQIQANGTARRDLIEAVGRAKAGLKKRTVPQLPSAV